MLRFFYNYSRYILDTPIQHKKYVDLEIDRIDPEPQEIELAVLGNPQSIKQPPKVFIFSKEDIDMYNRIEVLRKLEREKQQLKRLERQRRKRNMRRKPRKILCKDTRKVEIIDGLDIVRPLDYNKHVVLSEYKHKTKKDYFKYVLQVEKIYDPFHPSGKFIEVDTSVFTTHDIKRNLIYMTPKRLKK